MVHRLRPVAGFEIVDVAERHPVLQFVGRVAVHRLQQMTDVVAEGEPVDDGADEPGRGVVEDRHLRRTAVPGATVELVDLVAGLFTEQFHHAEVLAVEHVHRQMSGDSGNPEGVVDRGQPDQEAGWMDAGLAGEADEAARTRYRPPRW